MLQLKCPNCGADITLDDTREFGFCSYCGTKVLLDEYKKRVDGIPGAANLLLRAENILMHDDLEKAKEYYNRVLDIDIHNTGAILGLEMIKNKEDEILAEKKRQEEERSKEIYKMDHDLNYRTAKTIANFITSQYNYNSRDKYIEGVIKCVDSEYQIEYGLIPCSKEEAHKYVPTNNLINKYGEWGAIDTEKTNNELNQIFKKLNFKYDILFMPYEEMRPNGTSFFGGEKWEKTGRMTYDIWIKIWK